MRQVAIGRIASINSDEHRSNCELRRLLELSAHVLSEPCDAAEVPLAAGKFIAMKPVGSKSEFFCTLKVRIQSWPLARKGKMASCLEGMGEPLRVAGWKCQLSSAARKTGRGGPMGRSGTPCSRRRKAGRGRRNCRRRNGSRLRESHWNWSEHRRCKEDAGAQP